jgi:hypothetical protein
MRNITLKSALLPQAVSHGGRGAAPWLQLRHGHRDNVISYVVSPMVSICGERRSEVRVSDVSARRAENLVLGPEKLNSPQA